MCAAIAVLAAIGVAAIYVTDTHYVGGHDGPKNAARQGLYLLVGCLAAAAVLRIGYERIGRYAYVLFALALLALLPPLVAKLTGSTLGGIVRPRNGAYRWISLPGFQLQPSEPMKVAYVLALAWYLRYRKNYRRFGGLLLPFLISAVPIALILVEPDLGTALLLAPVLFAMIYLAGAKMWHLAVIALIGVAAVPLAWGRLEPYQRLRVTAMLLQSETLRNAVIEDPQGYSFLATKRQALEWEASSGYQLVHSKNAVGSGGILGWGWGKGIYVHNALLPDRHNDFILAIIGHQWGLVGCLTVLACYVVIVVCGVAVASATTEPFGRLLAVGVVALLAAQAIVNCGMAIGLMPTTGMTLPFVSFGGSSMLTQFLTAALLVSVSQRRPFLLSTRPFEFNRPRRERTRFELQSVPPPDGTPVFRRE